jgi:F420-non-reducing hydrogenase iron-sulfur subunit
MSEPLVVVFTCNWTAYSSLETAGAERRSYPAAVRPLKVQCLGRLSPGIILKAFEKGAGGVLLLGCPPGECTYGFGNHRAEEVFEQAREMAELMGIGTERLRLDWLPAGEGEAFVTKVSEYVVALNGGARSS